MWFFCQHPVDPIKERYRKFGRIAPVEYGTEYPGDGRENLFYVVTYPIGHVVFAGMLIDSFDELPYSLGEDDAGESLLLWFWLSEQKDIDAREDVLGGDILVVVVSEHDREPIGFLIVPDMRPVFLIGYGSDKISQFLFPAGGSDSMTHGRHLLRGGQIGKEQGYCVRMGEKKSRLSGVEGNDIGSGKEAVVLRPFHGMGDVSSDCHTLA